MNAKVHPVSPVRGVACVTRRELAGYFATPVAWVFIVIFLVLAGVFTFYIGSFYERGIADLEAYFQFHPWLYLFLDPAISMRLWAEERRSGTIELLLTKTSSAQEINKKANESGFILQRSPIGIAMIPVINGQPISDEQFPSLPPKIRDQIRERRDQLQEEFRSAFHQFRDIDRSAEEAVEKFNKEVATFAMDHLITILLGKFGEIPEVKEFLEGVQNDILGNLTTILGSGQPQQQSLPFLMPGMTEDPTAKYKANLIVDNSELKGAPVVMELSPTHPHLFGLVQKEARFGALLTDYTMIRSGSAHKAR